MSRVGFGRALSLAIAATLVLAGLPVSPAMAASTFTGGVGTGTNAAPLYFPNDHTALGIHWKASAGGGLSPNTSYHLKVRFTVDVNPSPSTNRGFTWNPTTERWIQESEAWSEFPTVTTDGTGAITEQWAFVKFGDEAKSGDYRLMISLNPDGTQTYNASTLPIVSVLDMSTEGGWVHNGVATGLAVKKRIEVSDPTSSAIPWTVSQVETNTVDEDANGVIDDEDYGPAGSSGDYRLAMPTGSSCDIRYQRTTTVLADDYTHAYPDCDIAYGAGEMVPPGAASDVTTSAAEGGLTLDWTAATDAGSGIAGYRVFRWLVPAVAGKFTPLKELVASVPAAETAWVDTDIVDGSRYGYEIRAVDTAGNVGPRATVEMLVDEPAATERVFGDDRYATAIDISKANFAASSVTTAVVATGLKFPDALAASGLAGVYGSPILLVKDVVTPELEAELERLGATDVVLVGGTSAISDAVETDIAANYNVDRISGVDRYETAAAVALRILDEGGSNEVFVARGDDYADALAAAPAAWSRMMPVLLVSKSSVPPATAQALTSLATTSAIVVGGTAAVPSEVYDGLDAMLSGTLERWSGPDRYATAVAVAQGTVLAGWAGWNYVGLATGRNFPDALGGGAACGANGGVMLLTKPDELPTDTQAVLEANAAAIDVVWVFGGQAAVTDAVFDTVAGLFD